LPGKFQGDVWESVTNTAMNSYAPPAPQSLQLFRLKFRPIP
jgi:hypothetical protein